MVLSVLILGGVSNSVLAQSTSCYINVSFCRNGNLPVAQLGKDFVDNYEGASSNEWRCRARAADYANWCGNNQPWINLVLKNGKSVFDGWNPQNGPQVQANFVRSPDSGAATRYTAPGCVIQLSRSCVAQRFDPTVFYDNWNGSPFSAQACHQRAKDFHNWCFSGHATASDGVTATWIPPTTIQFPGAPQLDTTQFQAFSYFPQSQLSDEKNDQR